MVGALSLEVLEPLPCFVKGLTILLDKGGDVRPQLGSLARWEVLAEERLGEYFPSGERVGFLVLQSVAGSIPQ